MKDRTSFFILGLIVGTLLATVFFALKLGGFTTQGSANATNGRIVLKLTHGLENTHPVHIAMEKMKERLEELSDNKMSLDIYPGGPLGDEIKCIEQLKNGSLDMTKASTASVGMFVDEVNTLNLPYLFKGEQHYWNVLNSELGEKFFEFSKSKGLVGLTYYDAGGRSFYTTKKLVKTADDLKGMKIRVMNSSLAMTMISALGASPTPISAGELYTALAQGIVDGAENNFPTFASSAQWEVCKFFTVDEHTRTPDMLLISQKAWDKLSQEQQKFLKQAAKESTEIQRKLWQEKTQAAIELSKKNGVEIYYPDISSFKSKTEKIYDAIKGTVNGKLAEDIRSIK